MIEKNYVAELSKGVCLDAKSKIIKAAIEEFAMLSLAAARTCQIAAKAGVNHAAISYYFGGKKELYNETIRQLAEYVHMYMAEFFARGVEVEKSKSVSAAKKLVSDFVMSRVCVDSQTDNFLRSIILIITREEMYPTEAFDIIYEKIINPSISFVEKMLFIITKGKTDGEKARIMAQIILGQVMFFNSARVGFKRANNWKTFGPNEYAKVEKLIFGNLEKIFS